MLAAVGLALGLWVFGENIGVPPVVASMMAVGMLLFTGVLDWRQDCLKGCPQAFDTLFWFGGEINHTSSKSRRRQGLHVALPLALCPPTTIRTEPLTNLSYP
jgi:hypothetical protein